MNAQLKTELRSYAASKLRSWYQNVVLTVNLKVFLGSFSM